MGLGEGVAVAVAVGEAGGTDGVGVGPAVGVTCGVGDGDKVGVGVTSPGVGVADEAHPPGGIHFSPGSHSLHASGFLLHPMGVKGLSFKVAHPLNVSARPSHKINLRMLPLHNDIHYTTYNNSSHPTQA